LDSASRSSLSCSKVFSLSVKFSINWSFELASSDFDNNSLSILFIFSSLKFSFDFISLRISKTLEELISSGLFSNSNCSEY
jgi:hypothetical protein